MFEFKLVCVTVLANLSYLYIFDYIYKDNIHKILSLEVYFVSMVSQMFVK